MKWFGLILKLIFFGIIFAENKIKNKRQVSLDDLIQGALQFVKPIFDTSEPLKTMNSMSRVIDDSPIFEGRQQAALGIQKENSAFKDAPICRGNSQICKFIACAAHNFKHDENFANLNLATQLISDKKLRKTITNNPESVISVCREQGLSETQCKLFSQGFTMIDKFINVIEPSESATQNQESDSDATHPKLERSTIHPDPESFLKMPQMDAESDVQRIMPKTIRPVGKAANSPIMGSRTWSTHINPVLASSGVVMPRPVVPIVINYKSTNEIKPFTTSEYSTAPFHAPTATVPAGATPVNPIIQRPIAKAPTTEPFIAFSHDEDDVVIPRPRRETIQNDVIDFDDSEFVGRQKRDSEYYDQVESSGHESNKKPDSESTSDYYEQVENPSKPNARKSSLTFTPLNCFHLLG